MNVPPVSYSASSAVTSPEISGSGWAAPAICTLTLISEPILTAALESTIRLGSRKRSTKVSGSCWL